MARTLRRLCTSTPLLGLLAAGCVQPTGDPAQVGYVLFDRHARDALSLAHDGWEGAPALPLAAEAHEPATLRGPAGARPLELQGGWIAHVRGAAGGVRWLEVGEEARADRLVVHGEEEAARELAERLGAVAGPRGDGLWTLTAPDLLDRTSYVDLPAGILEVLPDTRVDLGDLTGLPAASTEARGVFLGLRGPDGEPEVETGVAEVALVGLYHAGERSLLLDASGGFTLEAHCSGEVLATGRFHADADRVALVQDPWSDPIVLARDGDALLHPGGAVFAPLILGSPKPERRTLSGEEPGGTGEGEVDR